MLADTRHGSGVWSYVNSICPDSSRISIMVYHSMMLGILRGPGGRLFPTSKMSRCFSELHANTDRVQKRASTMLTAASAGSGPAPTPCRISVMLQMCHSPDQI